MPARSCWAAECARLGLLTAMLFALLRSLSALARAGQVLLLTKILPHHLGDRALGFGSGMCKAGFAVDDDALRAATFPVGTGRCEAGFAGDDDPRDDTFPVGAGICKAGFAGDDDPRDDAFPVGAGIFKAGFAGDCSAGAAHGSGQCKVGSDDDSDDHRCDHSGGHGNCFDDSGSHNGSGNCDLCVDHRSQCENVA